MKIIHLISGYLGQGGAERLVVDLAEEQASIGHNVVICTFRDRNDRSLFVPNGVKYHSLGKNKGMTWSFGYRIKSYIIKEKPDVVNCHLPAVFPYLIPSLICCKEVKFFYTIHSNPIHEEPRQIIRHLRKFFIKHKKLQFVAISESIKSNFENLYGVTNILIIHNGRRHPEHSNDFLNVREKINKYKKNDDTKVFVAVGRLTFEKNHKLMIEAFSRLKDENIILLILGQGDKTQFHNILCNNTFLLGPKNNVHDYLYCADAFCMSSTYEGFPISIIEAMSIGLPILSTGVGGIPDVVKDGENGLLCNTLDTDDYVRLLQKFLSLQDDTLKGIAKNNCKAFKEKYDISITAEHYINAYKQ